MENSARYITVKNETKNITLKFSKNSTHEGLPQWWSEYFADLSLITDPSRFFSLYSPVSKDLDHRWCAICRHGHRVSVDVSQRWSIFTPFFVSSTFVARSPNERRNAREYERNIFTSDFRAKSSIRPSLQPWHGGNLPTLESLGEYFHNSVIRDFLACLRMSTKLTEGENNQHVRFIKK